MFLKVEKAKDDFYFIDLAGKEELDRKSVV